MIALWRTWDNLGEGPARAIAASLGLFAGQPADSHIATGRIFARLSEPRRKARPNPRWRPFVSRGGAAVLFNGWIDDPEELAAALRLDSRDPAALYGAAVDAWGEDADRRVHGSYCAAIELPSGAIRLSRSPWSAPPLIYANDAARAIVASVPRVLFAAGLPLELDLARFADNLAYGREMPEQGWYRGTRRVPHGAIVTLTPDRCSTHRWYDPLAIAPVRLARDDDYVDAAAELLGRAVGNALGAPRRPAIALSGGLDSATVADEILRRLPPGDTLRSYTAVPHPGWDGTVLANAFGDERPFVEAFAAMHPRLVPTFSERPGGGFDDRAAEMFAATGIAPRNLANGAFHHALWAAAREDGCDWMLDAELGNLSFSNDGRWAYGEYFRHGRWGQLLRALRNRAGDTRPLWRRVAAMSLLPLLPFRARALLRDLVHPGLGDARRMASLIRPEAVERFGLKRGDDPGQPSPSDYPQTRAESIRRFYDGLDFEGGEAWQGFEQVHGLRHRDVCAYRPLIEFCLGLPTDQLVRDGEDRWLARRLARGRLPESQRLNRFYGQHDPDWHARLSERRGELRAEAERLRGDRALGAIIDFDRLVDLLDDWPATTPIDPAEADLRRVGITRALLAARFAHFVAGRNDI